MTLSEEIRAKRRAGMAKATALSMERRSGWPVMHGTEEERDEEFCRQVIAEARRLKLPFTVSKTDSASFLCS